MADAQDKNFGTGDRGEQTAPRPDRADEVTRTVPPADPTAGTHDVKSIWNWRDQSQGPNHPLDDSGSKRR